MSFADFAEVWRVADFDAKARVRLRIMQWIWADQHTAECVDCKNIIAALVDAMGETE